MGFMKKDPPHLSDWVKLEKVLFPKVYGIPVCLSNVDIN